MVDYTIPKAIDLAKLTNKARAALDPTGWYVQPKYDGCAMHVVVHPGRTVTGVSASGKPVLSCPHILKACAVLGAGVYDMEVWVPHMSFQDISGKFRSHSPQLELQARIFDGYMGSELGANYPYDARILDIILEIMRLRRAAIMQCIEVVPHRSFLSWDAAWEYAKYHESQGGYDGAIIRDPEIPYVQGRSKASIVKLKPLKTYDLLVTRVDHAVGTKTGKRTCALVCRWKDGAEQKVATGLTQAQVNAADSFVGKIIEVRGMDLTEEGFIREPRFVSVRDDKLSPDY